MTNLPEDVSRYYEEMTEFYLRYGGDVLGWHFGLWEGFPDSIEQALTRPSFDRALLNSNRLLTEGCDLAPGKLVLDAGCGVGGLAFYLAGTFGVDVIGVTVCEPHVEIAKRFAMEKGLSDRVEFRVLDFMHLDFDDGTFDFAFNQESFCYAPDKEDYLKGIHRVLKPGGRWQAVDAFRGAGLLTERQESYLREMELGWKIAPVPDVTDVQSSLLRVGFQDVRVCDLSEMAYPTALINIYGEALNDEGARRRSESTGPGHAAAFEHDAAGRAASHGLIERAFTYQLVGAAKQVSIRES